MLLLGSAILAIDSLVWGVFFTLRGDGLTVAIDVALFIWPGAPQPWCAPGTCAMRRAC